MSAKVRECGACGGSGDTRESMRMRPNGGWSANQWRDRIYSGAKYACPVCLGSGRIVDDSTSRRDAVADAETLRQAWLDLPTCEWLSDAAKHGREGRGRWAARAAFKAVPGLR